MLVRLREGASADERAEVARILAGSALSGTPREIATARGACFVATPTLTSALRQRLRAHGAVADVIDIATPYQLASRAAQPQKTVVQVGAVRIGAGEPVYIAGPCAVESEEQIFESARAARAAGAHMLRGGAFKPRTSPYAFQGLGMAGVRMMARAGAAAGLPIVTEVMEPGLVTAVAEVADVLQIGSRNMQNYPLLRAAGQSGRPVLLKRGFAATIEEWLLAAEYILSEGNPNVVLCERGVRSFDPQTRNLLDLTCVPLLASMTHLPVMVDPSHATGRRDLVVPMAVAAVAAGADGLIVEMHPHPDEALSDSAQSIDPSALRRMIRQCGAVCAALAEDAADHSEPPAEDVFVRADR